MSAENQNEVPVTEEGWGYANDNDKLLGIESKEYDNGQRMRRSKLSDGRIAVARRLKGKDGDEIQRMISGNADKYKDAVIAKCVTIDGNPIVMEDLSEMWLEDVNAITMLASVNFPSTQNV